jgi:hypothetical protein
VFQACQVACGAWLVGCFGLAEDRDRRTRVAAVVTAGQGHDVDLVLGLTVGVVDDGWPDIAEGQVPGCGRVTGRPRPGQVLEVGSEDPRGQRGLGPRSCLGDA